MPLAPLPSQKLNPISKNPQTSPSDTPLPKFATISPTSPLSSANEPRPTAPHPTLNAPNPKNVQPANKMHDGRRRIQANHTTHPKPKWQRASTLSSRAPRPAETETDREAPALERPLRRSVGDCPNDFSGPARGRASGRAGFRSRESTYKGMAMAAAGMTTSRKGGREGVRGGLKSVRRDGDGDAAMARVVMNRRTAVSP